MSVLSKLTKLTPLLLLGSLITTTGVYGAWRYAGLPPREPDPVSTNPSIGIFVWIPGMGEDGEEDDQDNTNINALVEAVISDNVGLNNSDNSNKLIESIEYRLTVRGDWFAQLDRNTFGSMAKTSGNDAAAELVPDNSANLDWIIKWEGSNPNEDIDELEEIVKYELYSYNNQDFGSLGKSDTFGGLIGTTNKKDSQHYKVMDFAYFAGQDASSANTTFRNNGGTNGCYFGVIHKTTLEKNSEGNWYPTAHEEGHARASYYEENRSDADYTHIPAWDVDTWVSCEEGYGEASCANCHWVSTKNSSWDAPSGEFIN